LEWRAGCVVSLLDEVAGQKTQILFGKDNKKASALEARTLYGFSSA
jgi:hypothetical protein